MKSLKQIKEEMGAGAPANSVGGGMSPVVGNEGNIKGYDKLLGGGKVLRRKALDLLSKRRKGM
jgi:hypothetical protein